MVTKSIILGTDLETHQPFTIPVMGAATKTLGIFGKKGSGKTWTAALWVEQLLTNKIPVVILDPVGRWWDLGLSADGQSAGFPIAIFGGKRGQVELTPDMGKAIARYVAHKHVPTVVDLSFESKSMWRKIVAEFCDELFRINELPVHVVLEEAPEFIPQRIFGENAAVFGAVDKLVRLGRNHGIGVTAIGQRLQTTNKDTVSQVDALIVLRLVDPQGKQAARDWVRQKGEDERADEFVDALASLKNGSGYVWSPEWLETFAPVQFAARQTFHYDADRAATESAPTGEIARAVDTNELVREFAKFTAATVVETSTRKSDTQAAKVIADLRAQVENLGAALETAQAQSLTEEDVQQRIRLAVQEKDARLVRMETTFKSFADQIASILGEPTVATPTVLSAGIAAPQVVAAYVAKQIEFFKTRAVTRTLETMRDNYLRFPNGMTREEIALEAHYDPLGGRYNDALRLLVKRKVIVKDGDRYLLNPAHLK